MCVSRSHFDILIIAPAVLLMSMLACCDASMHDYADILAEAAKEEASLVSPDPPAAPATLQEEPSLVSPDPPAAPMDSVVDMLEKLNVEFSSKKAELQKDELGAQQSVDKEEKPSLINADAPAAPTNIAEARIALRQHREVSALNRFTFGGNVLEGTGDHVANWIVMFCPGWHEQCQGLLPSYELIGVQWENKLNKAVMSSSVRFGKVDCATEKALCVSLDIDDYPSVVHYQNGQRMGAWSSGAPGLVRFVKLQLEPPKRRPSIKRSARKQVDAATLASSCDVAASLPDQQAEGSQRWTAFRPVCFVLILVAAVHCAYKLVRRTLGSQTGHSAKTNLRFAVGPGGMRQHSSLQASLPEGWAHDRRAIVL